MVWSTFTLPPSLGLTSTVSAKVAPPQAASAGFSVKTSDAMMAIRPAITRRANEFTTNLPINVYRYILLITILPQSRRRLNVTRMVLCEMARQACGTVALNAGVMVG